MAKHLPDILFVPGREPDYIRNWMIWQALTRRYRLTVATEAVRPALSRYAQALLRVARSMRHGPDLIFVGFYGQPLVLPLRALTRRPLVLDAYVSTYDTLCFDRQWFRPRSPVGRLAYALDFWACRLADHVLFDTTAHRDYFIHTFSVPLAKTSVLYVGCDESHFRPHSAPPPDGTFKVFTYASFLRLHGVKYILQAARLLADQEDISFTIGGAGARLDAMKRLARDLYLPNVRFPGWIDFSELPSQIAQADLCLGGHFSAVPKASRVIATKTFQFLAMGRPTVVGDNPANREVLLHRQNAYLCRMADPAALAAAILELRDDAGLRRHIAESGLALYRQRFTVEATAQALQAVLDGLLA